MRLPQRERRTDALVGERRRQSHIEDAQLGVRRPHGVGETLGVRQGRDDLVAGVLEQSHEALAQQHGVLTDQDAHEICPFGAK